MTDTHHTHPTPAIIKTIADDLHASLEDADEFSYLDTLLHQVKLLAKLHQAMIDEAKPHTERHKHDTERLSLALRAQNQFCRSLLILEHLENRALDRVNLSNELEDKK